jgi:uncharacterized protein YdaU (DUF1376 family)
VHYYQFNIGDYAKHTGHLTPIEHLAYRLLLDRYYLTETPLELDIQKLSRLIGLRENTQEVSQVLDDFFEETELGWRNKRCDEEITKYHAKADVSRANGKKGGRPKNPEKTQQVSSGNLQESKSKGNHKPITNNHKPITNKTYTSNDVERLFDYWSFVMSKKSPKLTTKRKACITARLNEGYTIDQLTMAIEGCAASAYHMGQNDGGTRYDDLTLICRSGDKVESFIDRLNPVIREEVKTGKRKLSLAERSFDESRKLLSIIETGQVCDGLMGADGAAVPPQMGEFGGVKAGGRQNVSELYPVVPKAGGPDR